jgi:hypothetical protein
MTETTPKMLKPLIACAVGAVSGVLIALWGVGRFPVSVSRRATTSRSEPAPTSLRRGTPPTEATATEGPELETPQVSAGHRDQDIKDVLERARALAAGADVRALMALRDEVIVRAQLSGALDSDGTKQQVAEIDRDLEHARALRLALDQEEFRKQAEHRAPKPR